MDPTGLRLEKIRLAIALAEGRSQSYGRFYVALGAVAFAAAVSAVAAGLAGQLGAVDAGAFTAALSAIVGWTALQVRRLDRGVVHVDADAFQRIDSLMPQEGEDNRDDEASDEGRT